MSHVEVFAPGCIGNIGPGLDILGLAITGLGDQVRVEKSEQPGVIIADPGHPDLPTDPSRHASGIAAREVLRRAARQEMGVRLWVMKGLPLAGGQGGSAASAVAGAVATNIIIGSPLEQTAILECCLIAEETVAGRHLDNIAPSLMGGAVLVRSMDPIDVVQLPVSRNLVVVLAQPDQRLETRSGRAALPLQVTRVIALEQAAQIAAMVAAFASGDLALLGRAVQDQIAEPARAALLPGFLDAKAAALAAGAFGCSISGSGPTAFAFAKDVAAGERIAAAMATAYREAGVACHTRICGVDRRGARVLETPGNAPTIRTERNVSTQVCARCGEHYPEISPLSRCTCGGLLALEHPAPAQSRPELIRLFESRKLSVHQPLTSGVWRFRELVLPSATDIVSHPEGNTPLLERGAISRWCGSDSLMIKHEGHNPTGSFKDRGMTVGVTQAVRIRARAVACASTGNTSASLAAYAAQAGIPAVVLVPAGQVALGKLSQSLAYGAKTLVVQGDFDQCLDLVQQAEKRLGVYLLNSINPFRLEGQKSIVFELLEQLDWDPPDWIVVPAGNLGNTSAFGKALNEALRWGLIRKTPRIAAVQAAGAAPFYQSFLSGFDRIAAVKATTVATAIQIGNPASFDRAVLAIRETDGIVTRVTDDEIMEAKATVDAAGVGCEPASAASVAGVRKLIQEGTINPGDRVVAVLTGHVLKDPGALIHFHQETEPMPPGANRPMAIEASLTALEKALG
ncbi:MAG: threonine synthase [Gemmatimonadota bacterium]